MIHRFVLGCALAAAVIAGPFVAAAQNYPPPPPDVGGAQGQPPPPPPGGSPDQGPMQAPAVTGFHLRGVVAYSQPYFLMLDAEGNRVPVRLHDGTVILPTGLTLVSGMRVAIDGRWVRSSWTRPTFVADRIVLIR
jgi:hypothetical protein